MSWPVAMVLIVATMGACKTEQKENARRAVSPSSRCPKASVAWSLSGSEAPYKRAGLSTNPTGQEDALMGKLPTVVHQWAKACQAKGQWTCSSAAVVGFLARDDHGALTSVQAITPCPAARCLARQAAESRIPGTKVGTDICIYVELKKH